MNAVFNKDSILKASKWLILALFGVVLIVLKVVWAFAWGAFFGKDNNQEDKAIGTFIGADHWRADKDGYREW